MNRIFVLDLIMIMSDGFLEQTRVRIQKVDRWYQMIRLMVTPLPALLSECPQCSDHRGILLYTGTGSTMVPSQNQLLEIGATYVI